VTPSDGIGPSSFAGKVCLITGATGGIGKATAALLSSHGATTVLVSRTESRGRAAVGELALPPSGTAPGLLVGDLSEQREVRRVAEEFLNRYDRLDLLINNAGAVFPSYRTTSDGVESTFALNHLAGFLLSGLLLGRLRSSAPARIINITSATYRYARLDLSTLQDRHRFKPFRAYAVSKLANILFTLELRKRLAGSGVTAVAVHPGGVRTPIYASTWQGRMFLRLFGWSLSDADPSAAAIVRLAAPGNRAAAANLYFELDRPVVPDARATDEQAAHDLWAYSEKLTHA